MALFGKGKKGMNVGKKSMPEDVVSTQQPKVLSTAEVDQAANDVVARTLPSSGNKILDSLMRNKNNSFNTLVEAVDVAKKANEEEQKIKVQDRDFKNAASQFLQNLYNQSQTKTTYEGTTTKEEVEKDVEDVYSSIEYPSDVALERLGVQDYFPDIGTDINVGTYSGRRVGSVSIFAAPGMTIPFGLLDARKRALAQAAQNKSATMQKIQELPDTSDQFNTAFKQYAHSEISDLLAKYNYDPAAFMRDKDARAKLYRLQTTAKAIIDVDTQFDELLKNRIDAEGRIRYFTPEELLKQMYDFQAGKLDNMEDYFSGKKNVSDLLRNARNYADGTRMVDSRVAELLKYPRELPISIKKGVEITEDNIKEIEESRKRAASTGSYDSYVSVLKKFYEIDVDGIVDPWMNDAGYAQDSPAREWIKQYFRAQIPEETIKSQWDNVANKNFEYFKFNKEFEYKKEQDMAYWETVNYKFNDVNTQNKLSELKDNAGIANIDRRIAEIRADGSMSDAEKEQKVNYWKGRRSDILADVYNSIPGFQSLGFKVQKDLNNPDRVYGTAIVPQGERKKTATVSNRETGIYVSDPTNPNDKGKWVSLSELKSNITRKTVKQDGKDVVVLVYSKGYTPVTRGTGTAASTYDADMSEIIDRSQGGNIDVSAFEHQVEAAYGKGGDKYALNAANIKYYANSPEKTVMVTSKTNPILYDAKGNVRSSVVIMQTQSDLNSFNQLQSLEVISGVKGETKDKFEGDE